ncbi:MAG: AtpZ/AtpI family protein [Candidatus Falkowbacteria bacterium]|nr:AtpZ/AtpI family protein [Candidatus Falkowbacteria bacterium]
MKNESWSVALKVMANISGWIAFPVIIGLFLGRWLDERFGTEPWLFLATIGVCFLISIYGLAINALKEFKKIEREYAADKEEKLKAVRQK